MYFAELKTAKAWNLPLVVVLLSDGAFSSIKGVTDANNYTRSGVTLADSSWLGAVKGMGIEGYSITSSNELTSVLDSWKGDKPLYIEALFDQESYGSMTNKIR